MADSQSYSRIYDLKTAGVDKVIADINSVIARLEVLGQAKNRVSSADISDPAMATEFNKQMETLVQNVNKVVQATDANTVSQTKLADALTDVMDIQKNVTMNMQQSTAAMGENLTISTVGLTKIQATMEQNSEAALSYQSQLATLGERLAALKDTATATAQSLKILDEEFKNNAITEDEYLTETALLTTQLTQTKTQISEVTGAMTAMNKTYNPALLDEEAAALAANRVELQQRTQLLKLMAQAEAASAGSINEARAKAALLRKELNDLNITTEEGIQRQGALIKEIAAYDLFIKENADLYTRQKINIGNYPTVTAELTDLKQQMQQLALAGEQDSEKFKELSIRATELSASMREVAANTGKATFSLENIGRRVESMGFRMLVHLAVFAAAMEAISLLMDAMTAGSEAEKKMQERNEDLRRSYAELTETSKQFKESEIANTTELLSRVTDLSYSYNERYDAVKKLIGLYPDLLANMDTESILAGKISEKYQTLTDVIEYQAEIKTDKEAISKAQGDLAKAQGEYQKALDDYNAERAGDKAPKLSGIFGQTREKDLQQAAQAVEELQHRIAGTQSVVEDLQSRLHEVLNPKSNFESLVDLKAKLAGLKQDLQTMQLANGVTDKTTAKELDGLIAADGNFGTRLKSKMDEIKQLDDLIKKLEGKQDKKPQKDKATEFLNSEKDLTDAYALLTKEQIQQELAANKIIVDDTKSSLQERLEAAAKYYALLNAQADNQHTKVIKDEEAKKAELDRKKAQGKITPINYSNEVEASGVRVKSADQSFVNSNDSNSAGYAANKSKIYADQITAINKYLSDEQTAYQTAQDNELLILSQSYAKREISDKKYVDAKKKIQDKTNIDYLNGVVDYLTKEIAAANLDADSEKKLIDELAAYKKKVLDAQIKANEDASKKQHVSTKQIYDDAIGIVETFANAEMQILAQRDAYRDEMSKRAIDYNKKTRDSESQSLAQARANDKTDYLQQQQLDKQKAADQRRRAEEQLGINYAVALMKALADGDDPYTKAAAVVAATVTFGAAEAELHSTPAYKSGKDPDTHLAWVGDGGEPELRRLGNSFSITPSTPTLTYVHKDESITPFSQIRNLSGNMGASLQAPRYTSSLAGNSSNSTQDITALTQHALNTQNTLGLVLNHLQNLEVGFDTKKGARAIKNTYFKNVRN